MAAERKRRQRRRDKAHVPTMPDKELGALIDAQRTAIIQQVMADEIRPVVREAIDQDAIGAIKGMVGLAPAAILVLSELLKSSDEVTRSRAAQTIVKYTMGNALVTPPRADQGEKLVIINQLPDAPVRVDAESTSDDIPELSTNDDELRRCDTCRLYKPLDQFPGGGPRCQQCLDERKESVIAEFLPEDRQLLSENAVHESGPTTDVQRPSRNGQPEVGAASSGLQPGDVRPSWLVENRQADPSGHEGGSAQAWPARLRPTASESFSGPLDFKRFSTGR